MRSTAIGLLVAASVVACGSPEGRLFRTALPTVNPVSPADSHDPLPVVLRDSTGLVTGIEPAEPDPRAVRVPLVAADPTDPSAFIVSWVGGFCDGDATLTFWRSDATYSLHLTVRREGTGCTALPLGRSVRVETSSPIPTDSIVVSGGG